MPAPPDRAERIALFQRGLLRWFAAHGRDLPWRRTRDPYAILVSEFMLQQTQVTTVLPYYNSWLRRFPDLHALAQASESSVLRAWQGLGYYSRALNLWRCARQISQEHAGKFPKNPAQLRALPGIGRYTANAVAVFAFNQSLPIVEANIARVLARVFNVHDAIDSKSGQSQLWEYAARLVPSRRARHFQSALMDLGALVCRAGIPACAKCPVQQFCAAPDPALPKKRKRPDSIRLTESHEFIRRGKSVLLARAQDRWRGLWILPRAQNVNGLLVHQAIFPFTHHQIRLQVFRGRARRARSGEQWVATEQVDAIPIASPHRRAIDSILALP